MTILTGVSQRRAILKLGTLALAVPARALHALQVGSPEKQAPECPCPPSDDERTTKAPLTVEEHLALVERYRRKAAEYRKEADEHRRMLAGYRRDAAVFPNKSGREFPWFTKLRQRCEGYIQRADALADEAERFAEFHRMRARELQGE